MALTAAAAVALAAAMTAAAAGNVAIAGREVPTAVYLLALGPGLVVSARRPGPPPLRLPGPGQLLVGFGGLAVVSSGTGFALARLDLVGSLLLLAVIPLSLLWPRPPALRLCVFLAVGALLASGASLERAPLQIAAVVAGAAVALVITARLSLGSVPRLAAPSVPPAPRITGEAVTVLAIALLAGLVASTLISPPSARGAATGAGRRQAEGRPPAPAGDAVMRFSDTLDIAGGRPAGGNEKLFRVAADGPDVWRAQTFSGWDGRTWSTEPLLDGGYRSPGPRVVVPHGASAIPGEQFRQQVTVEAARAEVFVGAPEPLFFFPPGGARVTGDGTVRPEPPLGRNATYALESRRSRPSPAMLRAESRRIGLPRDPGAEQRGPAPSVSPRVGALVASVTAGAPTGYDKVVALRQWLSGHVRLETTSRPLPEGVDALERVLFTDRAGSPERVATAMALMVRSLGIPSRLAIGYLPGERSLFGREYVVRADDAHTWVEVMIGGFGWQRFDPTGLIARAERADSLLARLRRALARWWPLLVAAAVLGLAWLTHRIVVRRRRHLARPWVTRFFARLVRAGSKRGRPRQLHETPCEYTAALVASVLPDERLVKVGELVTAAAFSGREPSDEAKAWAEAVLREARASRRRETTSCDTVGR